MNATGERITILLMLLVSLCSCVHAIKLKDQKKLVKKHNQLRGRVSPTASNMERMYFNKELARVAQEYADRCIWSHNPDRSDQAPSFDYVGENLYITTAAGEDYQAAVQSWYDEEKDYDYDTGDCSAVCGHYTQVVWATTNKVGCGAKRCATVENLPDFKNALLVVCNYAPGGNYVGEKPYQQGRPCTACPKKSRCKKKKKLCYPRRRRLLDMLMRTSRAGDDMEI